MAFEKIYEFIEKIEDRINKNTELGAKHFDVPNKTKEEMREYRLRLIHESGILFEALRIYYETVLQTAKFKSQREYCKQAMYRINPSFMNVYTMSPSKLKKLSSEKKK